MHTSVWIGEADVKQVNGFRFITKNLSWSPRISTAVKKAQSAWFDSFYFANHCINFSYMWCIFYFKYKLLHNENILNCGINTGILIFFPLVSAVSPYLTNAWLVTLLVYPHVNYAIHVTGSVSCSFICQNMHDFDPQSLLVPEQNTSSTKTHLSNMYLFWEMITVQITSWSRTPSSKITTVCAITGFSLAGKKCRTLFLAVCVLFFICLAFFIGHWEIIQRCTTLLCPRFRRSLW